MSKKSAIYLNPMLSALIEKYLPRFPGKGNSFTVTEQLARFHTLLTIERRFLESYFTTEEMAIMLEATKDNVYQAGTIPRAVWSNMFLSGDEKYKGVDRALFLSKIQALNLGQQFALVDWLEEMRAEAV